mmetsp:Transcript_17487/g.55992  ORF Transcript_17487/g.55992 Transcript_17487/m.55992 type:complete len:329 (+) Transcript_17487:559-1545(+)
MFLVAHVGRDDGVQHQVEEQELLHDEEEEPDEAALAVLRVGGEEDLQELFCGAGNEHGVQGVAEGVKALVHLLAKHHAVTVLEQRNGDPGEEEEGADVEHGDEDDLAYHRVDAEPQAPHLWQHQEVTGSRNEGQAPVRSQAAEYPDEAVDDLEEHHPQAEPDDGQGVVLDPQGLEIPQLELPVQKHLSGYDEEEDELHQHPPARWKVRQIRQQNLVRRRAFNTAARGRIPVLPAVRVRVAPRRGLKHREEDHQLQRDAVLGVGLGRLEVQLSRPQVPGVHRHVPVPEGVFELPCCADEALPPRIGGKVVPPGEQHPDPRGGRGGPEAA